jgi:hypothetical protein
MLRDLSGFVMPGLVPGIHALPNGMEMKVWMAGTSPAMTRLYNSGLAR